MKKIMLIILTTSSLLGAGGGLEIAQLKSSQLNKQEYAKQKDGENKSEKDKAVDVAKAQEQPKEKKSRLLACLTCCCGKAKD